MCLFSKTQVQAFDIFKIWKGMVENEI